LIRGTAATPSLFSLAVKEAHTALEISRSHRKIAGNSESEKVFQQWLFIWFNLQNKNTFLAKKPEIMTTTGGQQLTTSALVPNTHNSSTEFISTP
jgi:hypothetical protein